MGIDIEENLIDFIDRKKKPIFLWVFLYGVYCFFAYTICRFIKRTTCRIKGCNIQVGSNWNMPPGTYCRWCDRCGATESNYEQETDYELITK